MVMFKPNTSGSNKFRKQHRLTVTLLSITTKNVSPRDQSKQKCIECERRKPLVQNSVFRSCFGQHVTW